MNWFIVDKEYANKQEPLFRGALFCDINYEILVWRLCVVKYPLPI